MPRIKNLLIVLLLIVIAFASVTRVTTWSTDTKTHTHSIEEIDKKVSTVLKLTAGATAASAVISLLPDDQCTPIANQLAELGKYFLVVLSALYLEKYLVTITGYVAFMVLVPIACLLWGIGYFNEKEYMRTLSYKVLICAVAIFLIVPTSVKVSDLIYEKYSDSVEITLKDSSVFDSNTNSAGSGLASDSENVITRIIGKAEGTVEYVSEVLSNFIESLAIMIVTSCLIPLVVLLFFVWLIKIVFALDAPYRIPILPPLKHRQDRE